MATESEEVEFGCQQNFNYLNFQQDEPQVFRLTKQVNFCSTRDVIKHERAVVLIRARIHIWVVRRTLEHRNVFEGAHGGHGGVLLGQRHRRSGGRVSAKARASPKIEPLGSWKDTTSLLSQSQRSGSFPHPTPSFKFDHPGPSDPAAQRPHSGGSQDVRLALSTARRRERRDTLGSSGIKGESGRDRSEEADSMVEMARGNSLLL